METPDKYIGPEHQLTGSIPPDHQLAAPPVRRRRKVWWIVLGLLLLLLGIGFLLLRRHDENVKKTEAAAKAAGRFTDSGRGLATAEGYGSSPEAVRQSSALRAAGRRSHGRGFQYDV